MAAEIVLGAVAESILNKALSLAAEEFSFVFGVKQYLESIVSELTTIQALVVDADSKDIHSETMQLWLKRLKAVASDADDVLEEYTYKVLCEKIKMPQKKWDKVRSLFSPVRKLVFHLKMAHKIKDMNSQLRSCKEQGIGYGFSPSEFLNKSSEIKVVRMTSPSVQKKEIVGRDEDVMRVVDMLVSPNSELEDFAVIGIVGLGGQGKTTLAQLVSKNDRVVQYFEKRIWVCVSEDFKVERLLNEMVQSITRENPNLTNRQAIIEKLQETLKDKRYLLVLDDVWNEDQEKWECMENELQEIGGCRGTKVMVTTRSNKVVSTMRASHTHNLDRLSDDHSWTLFKRRAFAKGGVAETPEFVTIGQRIVKRSGGVPLAIKVLGGLLYSKKDVREWVSIENSDIWSSANSEDGVLSSIKLTYNHLPSLSLRQCFAYCSIFPKDAFIDREKLIQLWMAQGFLNPPKGSHLQMEDLGNDYFDILLWNSLLQEANYDDYNKVMFCKMHDIVHDFALHVSKDYCLTMKVGQDNDDVKGVHLSLISSEGKMVDTFQGIPPKLRTLYLQRGIIGNLLTKFRFLRSLILCDHSIKELPTSIGKLKCLRCMDIERTGIRALPASYIKLYNLQILRVGLRNSSKMFVGTLIKLRHIHLHHTVGCMLVGIKQLVHLQTLPYFILGDENGRKIEELGPLNNLRGKLIIYGLEKVKSGNEAEKANLSEKFKVDHLELSWSKQRKEFNDEEVLEGLRPHSHLKGLKIVNFKGSKSPSWMATTIPNLVELKLEVCDSWEQLPTLGHLPSLQSLSIIGCEKLVALPRGLEFCKSLETVEVYNCHALSGVDGYGLERLPCLTTLAIGGFCKELDYFPWPRTISSVTSIEETSDDVQLNFASLQNLTLWGWPKVKSLPEQLQQLPSLRFLSIRNFKGLEALPEWIGSIRSLHVLTLADCENLENMQSREVMRRLTNLQELTITKSGGLKEKCLRRGQNCFKLVFQRSLSI